MNSKRCSTIHGSGLPNFDLGGEIGMAPIAVLTDCIIRSPCRKVI